MMIAAMGFPAARLFSGVETEEAPEPGVFDEGALSREGVEDAKPEVNGARRFEEEISIRRKTASPRSRTTRNVRGKVRVRLIDQRPAAAARVFSR